MKQTKNNVLLGLLLFILLLLFSYIAFLLHKHNVTQYNENCLSKSETVSANSSTIQVTSSPLTATMFVEQITVGWNLGNSLDSCVESGRNDGTINSSYYETAWGNPPVSKELIDCVSQAGFNTIRIPVTWYYNTYIDDANKLCIQEAWLERVKEVVDYAIENDMYVILNSHHDANIIWADMNDIEEVSSNLSSLWEQIATYFKYYDEHLLFEGFNEINDKRNSWLFSEDSTQATNVLNQLFVDTVRQTGGNNDKRILVCSTFLNECSTDVLNRFVLPHDTIENRLLIDIHAYYSSYNQDLDTLFEALNDFSQARQTPVIIGEFGTTDHFVPAEYRSKHAGNYIARANEYNLKCFWWDNGSSYKLFDRDNNTMAQQDIIYQLMHPQKFETNSISVNQFSSITNYEYAAISSENGLLVSSEDGALTLNLGNYGYPISIGYGYRINLTAIENADGVLLYGIAYYDAHGNFLSYEPINGCTTYDITPSDKACYMKITMHNGWGYRSYYDYENYFDQNQLYLDISEYKK